jgi:hypothetical protein
MAAAAPAAGEAAAVATESAARGLAKGLFSACGAAYRCSMQACNFCGGWCVRGAAEAP